MRLISSITFLLAFVNLYSQNRVLDSYDFNDDLYTLFVIDVGEPDLMWERDSGGNLLEYNTTKHYYTADSTILNRIKKTLIGDRVEYYYECGYDYFVYLTENDSIILEMRINLECGELLVQGEPFKIDPEIVTKVLPQMDDLKKRVFKCDDFQDGRDFWDEVILDNRFVLKELTKPKWVDYEGDFMFFYLDTLKRDVNVVKDAVSQDVSAAYPNEDFSISLGWHQFIERFNGEHYSFHVSSSENFYKRFDLFEKEAWNEYSDLRITTYWKQE